MRCSLIKNYLVDESKGGNLGFVSEVWEVDTLVEFSYVATQAHIAPALFEGNKRDGTHFKSIDFVSFDFDDGTQPAERVHAQLCDRFLNHALLASKNHLKDKGDGRGVIERFHVFIPLSKPIVDRSIYKFSVKKMAKLLGWNIDPASTDATRYFYRHGETLYLKENLKALDTDWIQSLKQLEDEKLPTTKTSSAPQVYKNTNSALDTFQRTKAWRVLTEEMSTDGQRYAKSAQIVGVMKKCGVLFIDAIELFDEYATYGESFSRKSVERMFREFR